VTDDPIRVDGACPSVLILGAAKSGTTALFYAVRTAMEQRVGQPIEGLFERRSPATIKAYLDGSADPAKLSKALLGPTLRGNPKVIERFDRKVVIYRDPRDNIVSRLLFMPAKLFRPSEHDKTAKLIDLIRRKEADPTSISVTAIITEMATLAGRDDLLDNMRNNAVLPAKVKREHGDRWHMMPYDRLIAQDFAALGDYVGFPIGGDYAVGAQHGYVARGKGSGEWRNWFLPEDLPFFAGAVGDDYRLLGFDPDEMPDAAPSIDPKTGSAYLAQQFERIREKSQRGREKRRTASTDSPADAAARLQRQQRRQRKREKASAAGG
jgi:hypothetical protein